ncbi:MAG: replicative DNA helicase [Smithella sp.]
MNNTFNKTPPHDHEAEAAVLGSVLFENNSLSECLPIIGPDDFYSERNKIIFRALIEIADSGKPIDGIILSNFLKERGNLDKVGGQLYIAGLLDSTPSSVHIAHYAQIVKDKSILRTIAAAGEKITIDAFQENGAGPAIILDEAQRALMEISVSGKQNNIRNAKDVCQTTLNIIEENYKNKNFISGLSTGFNDLDNWTSGLQDSELIIIAGRPSMGKTAFAVNILENVVLSDIPAAIFSLEMSSEALMTRIFSSLSKIDSTRLRRGRVFDKDWPHLVEAVNSIGNAPLFIDDTANLTPMQLKAKARRLKIEKDIKLIVIDYLQLMTIAGKTESREREIAEISRSLKSLAKELKLPVVALSQLNRAVENRAEKRPSLADLRESGAIEQDADVITFIYRDEVYNRSEDNPERGFAEINIAKQRNGPIGAFKMRFNPELTRFYNLEKFG